MPHQCTNCGRAFEDGSKEMLSGCPDCGGNKFQFLPASAVDDTEGAGGTAAGGTAPKKSPQTVNAGAASSGTRTRDAPETGGDGDAAPSGAVDRAAATVRDWVSTKRNREDGDQSGTTVGGARSQQQSRSTSRSPAGSTGTEGPADHAEPTNPAEDSAQASARRDLVSADELPDDPPAHETEGDAQDANVVSPPEAESPGLDELREELNSQFESIRIVNPGQYELNLMELYNREEYIIALKQDGKYVIEVPDSWEQ